MTRYLTTGRDGQFCAAKQECHPRADCLQAWALTNGALVAGIMSAATLHIPDITDCLRRSTSASTNIATSGTNTKVNGYMVCSFSMRTNLVLRGQSDLPAIQVIIYSSLS